MQTNFNPLPFYSECLRDSSKLLCSTAMELVCFFCVFIRVGNQAISIGPEIVKQAVRVLEKVDASLGGNTLLLDPHDFGGIAIDNHGHPLPESTLKACQAADAILMGRRGLFPSNKQDAKRKIQA